ncbi:hypothetical protein [Pseudomonas sp. nanlin1]|uniref:hypothetical protein n=1 Tax=Pseudomonas sp. nanlin1 TaxID=3040605 RepID=UPI00388F57C9
MDAVFTDPITKQITGAFGLGSSFGFQLFRLLANGSFDPAFGTAGLTIGKFGSGGDAHTPTGLNVLKDGRILVTGTVTTDSPSILQPAMAAFHADGKSDEEFGNDGSLVVPLPDMFAQPEGESTEASAGVAQPSSASYVFSFNGNGAYRDKGVLIRVTEKGALDTSFAGAGYKVFQIDNLPTRVNALLVQPGDKIVVVGSVDAIIGVLARFTSSGELDKGFAENGRRLYAPRGYAVLTGLTSRADERLVAVGYLGAHQHGLVVATSKDGAVDFAFNDGFPLLLQAGSSLTSFHAVAVQLDGLVVIAGNTQQEAATVFRLKLNGDLDTAFASKGYISGLGLRMTTMALQTDSNILLGGALTSKPVLKRYLGGGPVAKKATAE